MVTFNLPPLLEEIVYHRSPTLNLLLVMVIIWTTGVISRRIKQPPLLGELLAGIIFGPSLLGIIRPDETLKVLAELGVFFLMFYAGLESNLSHLRRYRKPAVMVAIGGYMAPFLAGYLTSRCFDLDIIQSLFIGQALAITAIAVSARILHDVGLGEFRITPVIMGAGVLDDIIALTVFTTLVDVASNGGGFQFLTAFLSVTKAVTFFAISFLVGRWLFPFIAPHLAVREAKGFTFSLVVALLFGFWAEISGLHLIIGAYIAGIFVKLGVPSRSLFIKINDRFVAITYGFLGPIFFFSLSFHVTFGVLQSHMVTILALLAAAIFGKFAGAYFGARYSGMSMEESTVIGMIMNGRGAVELIIASVGLEVGIIDDSLFSILVFIAFVTTLIPPLSLKVFSHTILNKLQPITPSESKDS